MAQTLQFFLHVLVRAGQKIPFLRLRLPTPKRRFTDPQIRCDLGDSPTTARQNPDSLAFELFGYFLAALLPPCQPPELLTFIRRLSIFSRPIQPSAEDYLTLLLTPVFAAVLDYATSPHAAEGGPRRRITSDGSKPKNRKTRYPFGIAG